jgi:hypothetical protein
MKSITLRLADNEFSRLAGLLLEKAMEIEDDGNEGDPDAALLYRVAKLLKRN